MGHDSDNCFAPSWVKKKKDIFWHVMRTACLSFNIDFQYAVSEYIIVFVFDYVCFTCCITLYLMFEPLIDCKNLQPLPAIVHWLKLAGSRQFGQGSETFQMSQLRGLVQIHWIPSWDILKPCRLPFKISWSVLFFFLFFIFAGVPSRIRCDAGTENVTVLAMQKAFM